MNDKYEPLNSVEEQEIPFYIREVLCRIEEEGASLLPLVSRYREKATDHQRAAVALGILSAIKDLRQAGEWFSRCHETYLHDRKAGEKLLKSRSPS